MQSACYSCQILIKIEFSQKIFEKYSDIKFHGNPSSQSRVDGRAGGRTDMTKVMVAFHNFVEASKKKTRRRSSMRRKNSIAISLY